MVVPFDEFDKHSLSIFMSSERNMLNSTGSWYELIAQSQMAAGAHNMGRYFVIRKRVG